ncbi:MAG: GNAT family N-acetyltransferase, partial [Alphaproteobacteria bacterium]|nr:GNAT family N-acetyltransferase [Alphaproteobacteria bacterium]
MTAAWRLRRATLDDADALAALVNRAYGKYVARIGRPPLPMTADYSEAVGRDMVWLIEGEDGLAATIVLVPDTRSGRLCIENVAVEPELQGNGLGRRLMRFAEEEARRLGFGTLYLYTNEAMTENIDLYTRLGYRETHREQLKGRRAVFMEKAV